MPEVEAPIAWRRFADLAAASNGLAEWSATLLRTALAARATATLAVPGGSTPGPYFDALGAMPLDWRCITVLPTDERCVPLGHPRANETMIRARFSPVHNGQSTYLSMLKREGEQQVDVLLRLHAKLVALHPIDVLVSGMGEDAHICSLFPGDTSVDCGETVCSLIVATKPPALEPRFSLSPAALAKARHVALLFAGQTKAAMLDRAIASGDRLHYPVLRLLDGGRTLHVFMAES